MQLYNFFNSSTSYRVRIALALKEVDYQHQGVNIRIGEETFEQFIKMNPSKAVPVLVMDEVKSLSQSMAILDYLDQAYPDVLLMPQNLEARMRVMELSYLIASDMHPVNNLRILNYLTSKLGVTDQQKSDWYRHWANEGFIAVESLLERYGHGDYCFGQKPTIADCCLVPQVANALRFGCDLSSFPKIMEVYKHCLAQPAFQKAAPNNQPDNIT